MKRFVLATIAVAISTQASAWQDTAVLPTIGIIGVPPSTPTPLEKARITFEDALRAYNGSKVRTKAHRDYVVALRSKFAAEYRRVNTPPSEYARPYTGQLTIERLADPDAVRQHCPDNKHPVGCAVHPKDLSRCTIYIVSDAFLKKRPPDVRKLFDQTYEGILRHELAHCNGWPGDHPH